MAFRVDERDNVATLLEDVEGGSVAVMGAALSVEVFEPVKLGHKIALGTIERGEPVVKFGVPIGYATASIPAGGWVHLHNCASDYDARSQTLDVHSGAATDTRYE